MGQKFQKGFKLTSASKTKRNKAIKAHNIQTENNQEEKDNYYCENVIFDDRVNFTNKKKLIYEDFLLFHSATEGNCTTIFVLLKKIVFVLLLLIDHKNLSYRFCEF